MFYFTAQKPRAWPAHLAPVGMDTDEKESFEAWWARNGEELKHLHPMLAEQWVYRHWYLSEFACLPIETITWELVKMSGEDILATVKRELGRTLDADIEYENHQGRYGEPMSETAVDLEKGTWTYPIIALSMPTGWRARDREYPDVRMMLVEGHSRHAYLYALHAKGLAPAGPHEVFVIRSPLAEEAE